jgi:hypothetical protein
MRIERLAVIVALVVAAQTAWARGDRAKTSEKNLRRAVLQRLERDGSRFPGYLDVEVGHGGRRGHRASISIGPGTYGNTPENVQAIWVALHPYGKTSRMPHYRLDSNGVNQPMFNLSASGRVPRIGNFRGVRVHIGYAKEFGAQGWLWAADREKLAELLHPRKK